MGLRDQRQVQFVLAAGEALRQQSGHPLGTAAAKMRNEQENPGRMRHSLSERPVASMASISQVLQGPLVSNTFVLALSHSKLCKTGTVFCSF